MQTRNSRQYRGQSLLKISGRKWAHRMMAACKPFRGNSFDALGRYGGKTMLFEMFLKRINHSFEEQTKRAAFSEANSTSLSVNRNITPHDAATEGPKDLGEVLSQDFIRDIEGAPPGSMQTLRACGRPADSRPGPRRRQGRGP